MPLAALARDMTTHPLGSDHALEVGHDTVSGTSKVGGKPRTLSGRYIGRWKQDADGTWRIFRDLGSEAPAKAAAGGHLLERRAPVASASEVTRGGVSAAR